MMIRSLWKTVGLSLCCLSSSSLLADETSVGVQNVRLGIRHLEPKGIGFNDGYTTVEGFFAPPVDRYCFVPFLDVRGHMFNNGRIAANAGLGVRQLWGCRVYGVNAYYDYRNTKRHTYNQVSVGLESLGTRWDFKANGYFPVGSTQSAGYQTQFEQFSGNSAIVSRKYEFAMKGVNAEAGAHFGKTQNLDFYVGAGPYYFEGKGKNAWGGKINLWGKYRDYVALEVSESYDNVFHNIVSGQVAFMFPIGCKTVSKKRNPCCNDPCFLEMISQRMVQPVEKQEIIVVDHKRRKSVAIDPATALPFQFWFVNNLSSSNGTFESPYPTLALAQAASEVGDIIYIFPGNNLDTGMSSGITLKNRQRLWGSSIEHPLNTSIGAVTIPALSGTLPLLRNTAGAVITVANNNEIAGLFIQHTNGIGITGANISNLTIMNNSIQNNGSNTNNVGLTNISGKLTAINNSISNNQQSGIAVSNTNINNFEETIQDNFFRVSAIGINANFANSGAGRINVLNNVFLESSTGFQFIGTGTIATPNELVISGNLMNTIGSSLSINSTNADYNLTCSGNQLLTSSVTNTFVAAGAARAHINLSDNIIAVTGTVGMGFSHTGTGMMNIVLEKNQILQGTSSMMSFTTVSTSQIEFSMIENMMDLANINNPVITSTNAGTLVGTFVGNQLMGGSHGFNVNNTLNTASARIAFTSNLFSGCTNGIFNNTGVGVGAYSIVNNRFDNCLTAIKMESTAGTSVSTCVNLVDNIAQPALNAYNFTRTTGALNLEPTIGNIGQIIRTGTITDVSDGFCN